jgi:hypothetical protein
MPSRQPSVPNTRPLTGGIQTPGVIEALYPNIPAYRTETGSEDGRVSGHVSGSSLFHRAFQFTIYNGPTNALVCNKTLIQMLHTKTFKITPTCFDHQMIIIREPSDPG